MSEFTEEDKAYRKEQLLYAWNMGRFMNDNPVATVHRVIVSGGNPALGIPPTKTPAPGFPKTIPVQYQSIAGLDIPNMGDLNVTDTIRLTAFDFEFDDEDIIELYGEKFRILSNEFDRATDISRVFISPTLSGGGG